MKFNPARYPLIIQVIDTQIRPTLLIYSPDFDFRISEPYDPEALGQTELLIRRMRDELGRKLKLKEHLNDELPKPTLPDGYRNAISSPLLSMSEAAKLLRISRQTLWRMCSKGKIPYQETPGGQKRFLRTQIEKLVLTHLGSDDIG